MASYGVSGEVGLALAIIDRAARDVTSPVPDIRKDALEFFETEWYQALASFVGIHPDIFPESVRNYRSGRVRDPEPSQSYSPPAVDEEWWTDERLAVAKCIGEGSTHVEAAKQTGVATPTVSYWCRKPGFYERAKQLAAENERG